MTPDSAGKESLKPCKCIHEHVGNYNFDCHDCFERLKRELEQEREKVKLLHEKLKDMEIFQHTIGSVSLEVDHSPMTCKELHSAYVKLLKERNVQRGMNKYE